MGAMMMMALVGAFASAFIELRIARKNAWLKAKIEKYPVGGIIFSLTLANLAGFMFGAGGLVVMMMFVISAVLTQSVYTYWSKTANLNSNMNVYIDSFLKFYRPVTMFIKFFIAALTFPIWFPIWNDRRKQSKKDQEVAVA